MIDDIGRRAKAASRILAGLDAATKQQALEDMAAGLLAAAPDILEANGRDVEQATAAGVSGALLDRLTLTESRVDAMAAGLRQVAALPDPVGRQTGGWNLHNGIRLQRVRAPLGVVAVIFEARPNVTADAAGLCLKSGNASILRGSSEALGSNRAIGAALRGALEASGLPADAVQVLDDTSRAGARALMQAKQWVDLLVPRGGQGLIAAVATEATVPVVIDGAGNCHVYVDRAADLEKARRIVVNAKTQRPGVCNAAETLLIHEGIAATFLPAVAADLTAVGVELRGDAAARAIVAMGEATEEDWSTEYLDLIMAVRVVEDVGSAIDHIRQYGTGHTEAIVTEDYGTANAFVGGIDAAVIAVNASTRFTDGEEFGFGAEIGISTQKLHVRGPMGPEALTSERYVIYGDGHIR